MQHQSQSNPSTPLNPPTRAWWQVLLLTACGMTVLNILNMAVIGYILVKAEVGPFVPIVPDFRMLVSCIPVVVFWETGRPVLMAIIVIELALSLVMVATGRYWVAVGSWLALFLTAAIIAYLIFFVRDSTAFL